MVQLQILGGEASGRKFESDHFPICVGRGEGADWRLDQPGVWARHFQIQWRTEGLVIEAEEEALLSVNDIPARRAVLRGGDVITFGAVKARFSLSPLRQSSMAARECLTWLGLGALCLGQVWLVYYLMR
jgi:predicted component of type VI protein secretion system